MKWLLSVMGIVTLIIILTRIDLTMLLRIFTTVKVFPFMLVNLLLIPGLFLKAMRWRYLLKLQGITYGIKDAFISYIAGIYIGMVTPGRVGEAAKAVYLKQEKAVPYAQGLAGVVADRLFDLYVLAVAALLGMTFWIPVRFSWSAGLFLGVISTAPLLMLHETAFAGGVRFLYRFAFARADKKLFDGQSKNFFYALRALLSPQLVNALLYSLVIYSLYFLQCYLLAGLLGLRFTYPEVVALISITSLISFIPVTVLGIGTREMGMVYLFSRLGARSEQAVAYSFIFFISFYILSGVVALAGWFFKSRITNEESIHRGFGKHYAIFIRIFSRFSYFLFSGGKRFSKLLLGFVRFAPHDRVLDIGCGVGNFIVDLKSAMIRQGVNCRIFGIDRSFEMIQIARKKVKPAEEIRYIVADAARMPFKSAVFDITFNALLMHHLPVELKKEVLRETARGVKDAGKVVLMDIDKPSSLIGWLIALTRWHVPTIRANCQSGLYKFFSSAGFIKERQIKRLGLFSYYLLRKADAI